MKKTPAPFTIKFTLFGMVLLTSLGISSILPVLPSMALDLHIPIKSASSVIVAFALPGFLLTPFYGFIADRYGRKFVIFPSLILFIIGGIGSFFSTSIYSLILFRILHGAGAGSLTLLNSTIIADTWQGKERTKMMGLSGMALGIGTGISPALGGMLGTLGWHWPFLLTLFAVPLLFTCAKLHMYSPSAQPKKYIKKKVSSYYYTLYHTLFTSEVIPLLTLTFCSFLLLSGPVIICYPLIATHVFNATPLEIGGIMSLASLTSALPASSLAFLHTKFSAKTLLYLGQIGYSFFILLLLLCAKEKHMIHISLLLIPLIFYGLAQGITVPFISSLLSEKTTEEFRASLMALNSMVMRLAQALGAILFSTVVTHTSIAFASSLGFVPLLIAVLTIKKDNFLIK